MENATIPYELAASVSTEAQDFSVKAGRAQPFNKSLSLLFFGLIWTTFSALITVLFLSPLFKGEEVHFKTNGVPTVASLDNLGPILMPAGVLMIFVITGVGMLSWCVYSFFKEGGYFVGTPTRLVHFQNGTIRSIDWEQFSGDIQVSGSAQKGDLTLQMRTGRMVNKKHGKDQYVPDVIYISEIPNVYEVEKICRKRIKENDPSPVAIAGGIV